MLVTHPEPFGVTVTDLTLQSADADVVAHLKTLLAEHGVLVLPGQDIGDEDFVAFLAMFGELIFATGETPVPGFPDLNVVSNVGRTRPPRSSFHVDTSYLRRPPVYTALRAVTIPDRGGATVFTDQYRAYDTLTADLRRRFEGRTLTHVVTGLELDDRHETMAEHPVFQRHPISGRTAVYLSTPQRCVGVSGMTPEQAEELVRLLFEHCTQDANTHPHAWAAGDIVLWDNRCVMHRGDHDGVVGDRVLHRGLVIDAASTGSPGGHDRG